MSHADAHAPRAGGERLALLLRKSARRLALQRALRQAAWLALAAVLALEVALVAPDGPGALGQAVRTLLLAASGLLLVLALARLLRAERPSLPLTAAVLDARLGCGAMVASAAEALDGRHPRFGRALLDQGEAALAGASPSSLVPLRLPPGLILAAAAALLLPLVLSSGAAAPPPAPAQPSLLSAGAPLAGGGAGPAAPEPPDRDASTPRDDAVAPDGPDALAALDGSAPLAAPEGEDLLAGLSLDEVARLQERLVALGEELRVSPSGAGGAETPPANDRAREEAVGPGALADALRAGEAERALRVLEELAEAARGGDRAAGARLERLAAALGPPGEGPGPDAAALARALDAVPESAAAGELEEERRAARGTLAPGRVRLPPHLGEAARRYFARGE